MSRSRRKNPFIGIAADSDKQYKQSEHRRERAKVKRALALDADIPDTKEFGDVWLSDKDGKIMVGPLSKWIRK